MAPSASAVIRLIAGVPAAEAATNFMFMLRLALAVLLNFSPSWACPAKILMIRCAAMDSFRTWCRSAIESCTRRLNLRRRRRNASSTDRITGPASNAISVNNQSIYAIQATSPIMLRVSLPRVVMTLVAASFNWAASKVNLETRLPAVCRSRVAQDKDNRRLNISTRRSITSRSATQARA